jgi:p70 ribosomal S6 kinase
VLKGDDDVSQFDTKFTKQTPVDSPDDNMLSESANQVFLVCVFFLFEKKTFMRIYFKGFTYVAPSIIEDMTRVHNGYRSPRKVISPEAAFQT